jgi:hypothetical protein
MHQGALFRPPVSAAAVNELPEHSSHTLQVGNLRLDTSHLACGAAAYVIRGTAGRHTEIEQIPDLGEAETQILAAENEMQAQQVVLRVLPVAAPRPDRLLQEPASFVVADRLHTDAGSACQFPDLHFLASVVSPISSLAPVPWYGVKAALRHPVAAHHSRRHTERRRRLQISRNGGRLPLWSARSGELFFLTADTLMATSISTGHGLEWTTPRALFARPELAALEYGFSVSADGRRFLIPTRNPDASAREINVVLNWFEDLKARAKQ